MKSSSFLLMLLVSLFVSCANKNNPSEKEEAFGDTVAVSDESQEFVEESPPVVDLTRAEPEAITENKAEAKDTKVEETADASPKNEEVMVTFDSGMTDKIEIYDQVSEGDSLMWIAFKIYGDYAKWKILKELNPHIVKRKLSKGTTLKYYVPVEKFVWSPKGLPYLIRHNDTLRSISKDKYGTEKKWVSILDNNRPMIKNPNLIFAGFTLYYLKDTRDLASE